MNRRNCGCCLFLTLKLLLIAGEKGFSSKPNFLIMMADDLGYGDLGCFGNITLATPNIDRLAEKGVKLTHVLAASALCSPSRAAFLTGRYPVRSGMAPYEYGVNVFVASRSGLPSTEITFAKLLQSSGYATAIIGKWHLGLHCDRYGDNCHHPSIHGFDHFYGIPLTNLQDWDPDYPGRFSERFIPHLLKKFLLTALVGFVTAFCLFYKQFRFTALIIFFFGCFCPLIFYVIFDHPSWMNGMIFRNGDVVEQPLRVWTLTKRFVHEAKTFIQTQQENKKPFMVFLSFTQVHTFLEVHPEFSGKSGHGIYGDSVQEVDWAVGQMIHFLEFNNVLNNTMILFTSDHGADIEDFHYKNGQALGGRNGQFSGGKYTFGMEGGLRVPTIFSWPGKFPEGEVINTPASLMDVFPTLINLAEIDNQSDELSLDGKNLAPLLTRKSNVSSHQFLFHYGTVNRMDAVTFIENETSVWKVHFHFPNWKNGTRLCYHRCLILDSKKVDPPLIYNVIKSPSELHALDFNSDKYQEVLNKVRDAINEHRRSLKPIEHQLTFFNVAWRPWLQPMCSFPSLTCQENINSILE